MFKLYHCISFRMPSSGVILVTAIQQKVKGFSARRLHFILKLFNLLLLGTIQYLGLVFPPSLVSDPAMLLLHIL